MRQLSLIFLTIYSLLIFSCNNATQKKFEFYYYPSRNVYYDVANSMYLYSLNGGATWDSLQFKAGNDPVTLGAKEIIYSESPQVWLNNEQHRSQYNAKTINIVANDSSDMSKNLAAERKIKKATSPKTQAEAKSEKKTFWQKIFGKKNKN